ncbi:C4-dicarboxylate TRAP transporter substrate-binding protein [Nitratireductor sp. ZSWI3]|uniref:C4-dicarboxylate TRAP transporter substrate-binding protein n=1 Tax=Nitratireductor sp. ZSWI3 TaxID=2966359 RepID=UPI0021505BC7|nr:C4-dicarboxylate TRAP transporter substrate-binding protein [Nitratireductor sp. ZSWI3]MCR4265561.1 C4-dicarboxylate TRAP transporter substrate-binding protein [Nitratireductor sp. ZSWI3]
MNTTRRSIALSFAAFLAATSAGAETSFIANSFYDTAVPMTKYGYIEWGKLVEELSGGDLKPEVYTGTVLLAARANLQGTQDNVVQVAHQTAVYTPSEMPVANAVQELGFNYSDPTVAIFAVADFSMHNPVQLAEWEKLGLVYLGAYSTLPYVLMCSSPVRSLEEIKGKRIRTAGSTVSVWVEKAGGIPVNVPSGEMYTGLERGTLDCASNTAADLIDRSLWEVAKHTTLVPTGMYWSGPEWGYNAGFWSTLTPDQRSVLMEASARSMARIIINFRQNVDNGIAEAKSRGVNVYEPEGDLMQSVEAFREETLSSIYETAETKYGVADAKAVIDDFTDTMAKWEALLANVDIDDEDALTALALKEIYADIDPASYGVK